MSVAQHQLSVELCVLEVHQAKTILVADLPLQSGDGEYFEWPCHNVVRKQLADSEGLSLAS